MKINRKHTWIAVVAVLMAEIYLFFTYVYEQQEKAIDAQSKVIMRMSEVIRSSK